MRMFVKTKKFFYLLILYKKLIWMLKCPLFIITHFLFPYNIRKKERCKDSTDWCHSPTQEHHFHHQGGKQEHSLVVRVDHSWRTTIVTRAQRKYTQGFRRATTCPHTWTQAKGKMPLIQFEPTPQRRVQGLESDPQQIENLCQLRHAVQIAGEEDHGFASKKIRIDPTQNKVLVGCWQTL